MTMDIAVSLFVVMIILLITLYYVDISKITNKRNKVKPPPGSSGWPIIGETLEYLKMAKKGFPEKFMSDRLRKHSSNIFRTRLYGETMVLFGPAEGNKLVFSSQDKLVKSWWPSNIDQIFANTDKTTTSEEALRLHRVVSAFVKPSSLRRFVETMDSATRHHFDIYWPTRFDVNHGFVVLEAFPSAKKYAFSMACRFLLSVDDQETVTKMENKFHHLSSGFISLPINLPGTKFNRAIKASREIRREIEKIVVRRRLNDNETTSDMLSLLLRETYADGELITETDIANKLFGSLVGAYDTIASTIVSIMSFLAELPHVYDGVFHEQMEITNEKPPGELLNWEDIQKMKYSWHVVCEALRLLPPTMVCL